ncbi:MAG: hypothetical protein LUE14_04675 [Clostridiales bacterium]|nr:hypothetical protein [Clostridiales bacterium]
MKTITILLTRYPDLLSGLVSMISRSEYSHISISLGNNSEAFFSFNFKGFAIEKYGNNAFHKHWSRRLYIRVQVTEEIYRNLYKELMVFTGMRKVYKYSFAGVILCIMHIPHKFHNRYFCSQFVAELLVKAGVLNLKKQASLYLPGELAEEFMSCFPCGEFFMESLPGCVPTFT